MNKIEDRIIVTLSDDETFEFDLEVPADLESEKLIDDIIQTIVSFDPDLTYDKRSSALLIPKMGMSEIKNGQTLRQAGIVNGDYLILKVKKGLEYDLQ